MTASSIDNYELRLALPGEVSQLPEVERLAAALFRTVPGLAWVAEGDTMSLELLGSLCSAQTLWVAVWEQSGAPVAFLAAYALDSCLYVQELSVTTAHQRKGIGAALMNMADEAAKAKGYDKLSLSTDREVRWNGPFYASLGFKEVSADELGEEHGKKVAVEAAAGFDMKRRCVMMKRLEDGNLQQSQRQGPQLVNQQQLDTAQILNSTSANITTSNLGLLNAVVNVSDSDDDDEDDDDDDSDDSDSS